MATLRNRGITSTLTCFFLSVGCLTSAAATQSAAREWNEILLESIRKDFARPTVHARNLFHISAAMWDAWATYDPIAECLIFTEDHASTAPNVDALRSEALSYAAFQILKSRFVNSPGGPTMLPLYDALMTSLGYNPNNNNTTGTTPDAIGNRIAAAVLAFGDVDNSNEANGYANQFYQPINLPLIPNLFGNPTMVDPARWQPLSLNFFVGQSGIPIPTGFPPFLSPEWGQVTPFALSQTDLTVFQRGGFDYWLYHDPGAPPLLGTPTADDYKTGFEMVAIWSSHLDPSDGVMMDISPASIGNANLPTGPSQYPQYYDFFEGGDWGTGYALNPVTGQPYTPQVVPRADYARVLAEFWADGPDSETPPGHWYTILNYVSDHPQTVKQIGGVGPVVNDLEWDVKSYIALGGAMHDCAISAWGVKGWYDYLRPISALRYLADQRAANPASANAINLYPGYIEEITLATTAPGQRHAHLVGHEGEIAVKAWRGPRYIPNPATDVAGVGWIPVGLWWPYQRPSFVTPPFAGYVSGHSTYSRAAAVVLHKFTGSPWFPGGLGEFVCPQDNFLVFERGPSVTLTLQWASYYDASDQTSLSRIWGGIHPPADDIPGRIMGEEIGNDAYALAEQLWAGAALPQASYTLSGAGCPGSSGNPVTLVAVPSARPVLGSTLRVDVTELPLASPVFLMVASTDPIAPSLNLAIVGAPGCLLEQQILLLETLTANSGAGSWSFPIANNASLIGQSIYHQAVGIDPTANLLGLTTSNLGTATVGL